MTVRYQMKLKGLDEYLEHIAQSGQDVDAAAAKAVAAGGDILSTASTQWHVDEYCNLACDRGGQNLRGCISIAD